MSKYVIIPLDSGRRQYINTDQIRCVHDQKDEDTVIIDYDAGHKEYLSRDRAAPLLKWLKSVSVTDTP